MSGSPLNSPEPVLPTGNNPEGGRGLQAVLRLSDFRKLWIGQIFSQLADKFYIVLMVFLIDQHLLLTTQQNGVLAEVASDYGLDISTRTKVITLLATGIFVANTLPAMVLGSVAGVWVDRWPKRRVMVASNGLRALMVMLTPAWYPAAATMRCAPKKSPEAIARRRRESLTVGMATLLASQETCAWARIRLELPASASCCMRSARPRSLCRSSPRSLPTAVWPPPSLLLRPRRYLVINGPTA